MAVIITVIFVVAVGVALLLALFKGGSRGLDPDLERYEYEEQMHALSHPDEEQTDNSEQGKDGRSPAGVL